jgi:DNA-binding HxlR family transcriptional regulator
VEHHFSVEIAEQYGVTEAILLNNLYFWIKHNEANGVNFHDGSFWTYNSVKAFSELFPYVSGKTIERALKHLQDEGLVISGNYNDIPSNRTLWYSLTDKGFEVINRSEAIGQNVEMHLDKLSECIQTKKEMDSDKMTNVLYTDNKPDNKPDKRGETARRFSPPSIEDVENYCKERNNGVNPQQFVDFYESKGWKVGNQTMKDWKACVRTWEQRDGRSSSQTKPPVNTGADSFAFNSSFDTDEFFQAALKKSYGKTGDGS